MSKIRLFFTCLGVLLLCSCTITEGSKDEISYFPVQLEEEGRWSMIGPDGKFLFQDEFKEAPTAVVNGVFVVSERETYSIYRAAKKSESIIDDLKSVVNGVFAGGEETHSGASGNLELIVDGLKSAGIMSEGLIPTVKKDGRIIIIDNDGNEKFVLGPHDGKEIVECHNQYSEGLLAVKTGNNKWGYVDTNGKMVISPKYDYVNPFNGDYATAYIKKNDGFSLTQYIINKKGETVLKINERYGSGYGIKDGLVNVYDPAKGKSGFLNIEGEFISVPSKVNMIYDFNKDVFVFGNEEGKCGVISLDENNTQLIRPKYDYIKIISSTEFLVRDEDKYYVVNNNNEKIIDFSDYDEVVPSPISTTQSYIAKDGNVWVHLDKEGKQLGNLEFYNYSNYVSQNISEYEGYDNVYSDYFDAQSVTNVIEDCLTTYVLGESMSKYVTNPEECDVDSYVYSVPNFDKKEDGNNIIILLESNLPYIKYNANNTKAINVNSKLKTINFEIWALGGYGVFEHSEKIDKQVTDILQSKGFKKEEDGVFEKDDIRIDVNLGHDCGYGITISKERY